MTEPIRILILAANPIKTDRLALDDELRVLRNKMGDNAEEGNCELLVAWAARLKDLKARLASHRPHVVHFAGHGTPDGICLEDDKGERSPVTKAQLAELFSSSSEHLRMVVLNACFSARQAEAINQSVDYVVGTNAPVSDDTAVRFAAHFYEELAIGKTVREAHYKSQVGLTSDCSERISKYELLVRNGTDETRPLLPPMLAPIHTNIYEVVVQDARLPNAEFVNVSHEGLGETTSSERQGPSENNTTKFRIDNLDVTYGTVSFIGKRIRK